MKKKDFLKKQRCITLTCKLYFHKEKQSVSYSYSSNDVADLLRRFIIEEADVVTNSNYVECDILGANYNYHLSIQIDSVYLIHPHFSVIDNKTNEVYLKGTLKDLYYESMSALGNDERYERLGQIKPYRQENLEAIIFALASVFNEMKNTLG